MPGTRSRDGETLGIPQADGVTVKATPKYCAWHHGHLGKTNLLHTEEAFLDWLLEEKRFWGPAAYPHTPWTRFPEDIVWQAVLGQERYPEMPGPGYFRTLPREKVIATLREISKTLAGFGDTK